MVSKRTKVQGGGKNRKGMAAQRQAAERRDGSKDSDKAEGPAGTKGTIPALQERDGASLVVLRQVGMEVLRQDLEPAAWARALVEGSGSRDNTLSHYARIRVEALSDQERERQGRKSD